MKRDLSWQAHWALGVCAVSCNLRTGACSLIPIVLDVNPDHLGSGKILWKMAYLRNFGKSSIFSQLLVYPLVLDASQA